MVDMKFTRTFDKLKFPADLVQRVRDWANPKGICSEDASVVKVIGTKEQIDELDTLIGGSEKKAEAKA